MEKKVIIVTGSVGSGKTTLAKKLALASKLVYLDVNLIINKHPSVVEGYDEKRQTKEINTAKLNKILIKEIKQLKKGVVIDSHLSHYLPKKYVNLCIVCKCTLKELKKRLLKRKYSALKIKENLQAEVLDVCFIDALEMGHNLKIIYTDKGFDRQFKELVKQLN
ncbi:MAG: AAA family ATPase [Candidatus Nanoarchaeia archaeon]